MPRRRCSTPKTTRSPDCSARATASPPRRVPTTTRGEGRSAPPWHSGGSPDARLRRRLPRSSTESISPRAAHALTGSMRKSRQMRSLLVHRESGCHPGARQLRGVFVALHGAGGDADELVALCQRARPDFALRAAHAARPRNPIASGSRLCPGYEGFVWFRLQEDGRPDPATFEDSRREVEAFLRDTLERMKPHGTLPLVVVARGQAVALARAAVASQGEGVAGLFEVADPEESDGAVRLARFCDELLGRAEMPRTAAAGRAMLAALLASTLLCVPG